MEYYDDKVHQVAQIIADKTEHYTQFHRGLDSVSANKIREAAKTVVEFLSEEKETKDSDTTFLFFKETGKWKYEGRGWFPQTLDVNRETIMAANGGEMPGIISSGDDYVIVVIPDEDSKAEFAYPRMIKPVR